MGHENAEGMAHVGVRVEPTVRLGSVGTVCFSHLLPTLLVDQCVASSNDFRQQVLFMNAHMFMPGELVVQEFERLNFGWAFELLAYC